MHKNWKAIAAVEDPQTRLCLMAIELPSVVAMIQVARPDLFQKKESKPIKFSAVIKKQFEILRAEDEVVKGEPELAIRSYARSDFTWACKKLHIPIVDLYPGEWIGNDPPIEMPPELLPQIQNYGGKVGGALTLFGGKLIIAGQTGCGYNSRVSVVPAACIKMER